MPYLGLRIELDCVSTKAKTKAIRVKQLFRKPLVLNYNVIEQVGSLTYLGRVVNREEGSLEGVQSRIM